MRGYRPMDEMVKFPDTKQLQRSLSYTAKQLIANEIQQEKQRRLDTKRTTSKYGHNVTTKHLNFSSTTSPYKWLLLYFCAVCFSLLSLLSVSCSCGTHVHCVTYWVLSAEVIMNTVERFFLYLELCIANPLLHHFLPLDKLLAEVISMSTLTSFYVYLQWHRWAGTRFR